jgi:uncharacterized protein YabE (DUF348 family)
MDKKYISLISFWIFLMGVGFLILGSERPVTIYINGQPQVVETRAFTVGWALNDANISISPSDQVLPGISNWLGWDTPIYINKASHVFLSIQASQAPVSYESVERIPGNILAQAGVHLFPGDQILWNGESIDFSASLPVKSTYHLQLKPGKPITLVHNGYENRIYSSAATVGSALWNNNVYITAADSIWPNLNAPVTTNQKLFVSTARIIQVKINGETVSGKTAGGTVGEALSDIGISLQGLDYSIPDETAPVPENGTIQVVKVHEEVIIEQNKIPFDSEFAADAEMELDQRGVTQAGEFGIEASRVRVRYEDGEEVNRIVENTWIAKEPVTEKFGYGTKVVIRTMDTPNGPIEYWRAIPVYATSYSPCRLGVPGCSYGTSSGLPMQHGIIGVTLQWYRLMSGTNVYVPGYGKAVIADVGGGIPGKYWIDLAYLDDTYVPWSSTVMLYFLTPVPENITYILP